MALILPEDLDDVQAGMTPFGDINLKITRTTPLRPNEKKEEESSAPFYVLEPLAEMQRLALIQEVAADEAANANSIAKMIASLDKFIEGVRSRGLGKAATKSGKEAGANWIKSAKISRDWLAADPTKYKCPSPIFVKGNIKLPYWAFSALPAVTCPFAGACLKDPKTGARGWCYSFRGWRYPATFFRQFNLTVLMRLPDKWQIIEAVEKIVRLMKKQGQSSVVVRLYVDGDIDSIRTLRFWMETLMKYPMIKAYGYSKSWPLFLEYDKKYNGEWPSNYVLNLSSGSINDGNQAMIDAMMKLPITRERFMAVPIPKMKRYVQTKKGVITKLAKIPPNLIETDLLTEKQRKIFDEEGEVPKNIPEKAFKRNPVYKAAVEAAMAEKYPNQKKFFVCPNKCGNCLGFGKHACGQIDLDRPIVIGIH